METITIRKQCDQAGLDFTFQHDMPADYQEMLDSPAWGLTRMGNHAWSNAIIALRARAESMVKSHIRKALNVSAKEASDATYRDAPNEVKQAAIAAMQSAMPSVEIPIGERITANPAVTANKALDKLSEDQIVELLKARGLSVRSARAGK